MYRKLTIYFYFLAFPIVAVSQKQFLKNVSLNKHYGFIFAHNKDVENTAGARPFGVVLEHSFLKFDSASFNIARCYPKTGFNLIYFYYNNAILGHSVSCSYFVEPTYAISKRFMFAPRGSFGLSYLTNPYHPVHNPNNNSYSLPLSVFLQVGLVLNYKITKNAGINASANYLHVSNGGIRNPNKGINWPTASIGFNYQLNNAEFKKQKFSSVKNFKEHNRFEIGIYSSAKSGLRGQNNYHLVPGVFASFHRRINNLHSFGIIADFHMDHSLAEIQKDLNEPQEYYFPSIAAGHEYLIGKFNFWQQVGYYVIQPDQRFMSWYHRWGLNYALTSNFSIGMSLKAHAQVAHFADLRLCYNWKY